MTPPSLVSRSSIRMQRPSGKGSVHGARPAAAACRGAPRAIASSRPFRLDIIAARDADAQGILETRARFEQIGAAAGRFPRTSCSRGCSGPPNPRKTMPSGSRSMASRSRSCDLRASATALSASARIRSTSPPCAGHAQQAASPAGVDGSTRRPDRLGYFSLFLQSLAASSAFPAPLPAFCDWVLSAKSLEKTVSWDRIGDAGVRENTALTNHCRLIPRAARIHRGRQTTILRQYLRSEGVQPVKNARFRWLPRAFNPRQRLLQREFRPKSRHSSSG